MKEFILTEEVNERAVLVGLITPAQNEAKANEYLDELAFLAETAGEKILATDRTTQLGNICRKWETVRNKNIHRRERNRSRYLR